MPPAWRRKSDATGQTTTSSSSTTPATTAGLCSPPCQCWERSQHDYATHASRLAKEERRFPTGYYEFVINHTDNDRRAVLAAPGYDVLGQRQADAGLLRGRRGVAIVRYS
jgi:hypothetical protein